MTAKGSIKLRNQKFANDAIKHKAVARPDRESSSVVGPIMIGFLLFIVVGSALFEILRTATRGTFSD